MLLGHSERALLAEERLRNAAVLEIIDLSAAGETIASVTVRVRNEGAGHMLPTGVTEFREMWLEVTVRDNSGNTVFSSGGTGTDGELLGDTRVFRTVFGDPEGKPTINVTEAAVMLSDHRIQPKGWIDETFVFGKNIEKPFTVHAALKYRSMKPSLVRALLGDRDYDVPIIEMAEIDKIYR